MTRFPELPVVVREVCVEEAGTTARTRLGAPAAGVTRQPTRVSWEMVWVSSQ